jgi:hypothetical protein
MSQHQCKYCKGEYSTEESHYCSFAEGWLPAPAESKQTYETVTEYKAGSVPRLVTADE